MGPMRAPHESPTPFAAHGAGVSLAGMRLLLAAIVLLLLQGPARADEVGALLELARVGAVQMPAATPSPAAPQPAPGLSGPKVWVFAVGVLEFHDNRYGSFSKVGRRDTQIASRFAALGVPEDHIISLQDAAATLTEIRSSLHALLVKSQPGDILFFYYTGHGFPSAGELYLANYDAVYRDPATSWSAELRPYSSR